MPTPTTTRSASDNGQHARLQFVRGATPEDWPALAGMVATFIAQHYAGLMAPNVQARHQALLDTLLEQGGVWVLTDAGDVPHGFLAMALVDLPSSGERAGVECAWWVDPAWRGSKGGLALMAIAEQWALEQDVAVLQFMQPARGSEGLEALYRRRGYEPVETVWQKRMPREDADGAV